MSVFPCACNAEHGKSKQANKARKAFFISKQKTARHTAARTPLFQNDFVVFPRQLRVGLDFKRAVNIFFNIGLLLFDGLG